MHRAPLETALEIRTRTETAAFTGQNDGANQVVVLSRLERVEQIDAQLRRERVHRVGPVESNDGDAVRLFVPDDLAHFVIPADSYMLRRYSPPTSYSAEEICPSELLFTVSISSAKVLPRSRATACRLSSALSLSPACVAWKARTL